MTSIEALMRRVVREEVGIVREELSGLQSVVSGLRQEVVDERAERQSDISGISARLTALESKQSGGGGDDSDERECSVCVSLAAMVQ